MKIFQSILILNLMVTNRAIGQEMHAFKPVQWLSRQSFLANEKNASNSYVIEWHQRRQKVHRPAQLDLNNLEANVSKGVPGDLFQFERRFYGQTFRIGGVRSESMLSVLHRLEGSSWVEVGTWVQSRSKGRVQIFPLENGQFLAVGREPLEPDYPESASKPFALLRVDSKGMFEVRSLIDAGWPKWREWTGVSERLPAALMVHTEDYLTIVMQRYGLYWVFAKDNGRLLHRGKLYEALTDELIRKDQVLPLVLHVQPLADGSLLWSTRGESAAKDGASGLEDLRRLEAQVAQASPETQKGWIEAWRRKGLELENRFPEVVWWRFEPASGTFHRLNPAPPGARETRTGLLDLNDFHWVPTPSGQVHFVNLAFEGLAEEAAKARPSAPPAGVKVVPRP